MVRFIKKCRKVLYSFKCITRRLYNKIIWGNKRPKKREIIYVDPRMIKGHLPYCPGWKKLIEKTGCYGEVILEGNWDAEEVEYIKIEESEFFHSCYDHWNNGVSWEKTPYYKSYIEKLKKGVPNRFNTIKDLEKRYSSLDTIYDQIKTTRRMSLKWEDLVIININREGSLIWGPDGKHRVCIALCLGLEKIPVRLGFIHSGAVEHFQKYRSINSFESCYREQLQRL